ncbi:MAG TPA: M28 family peptidase [Pyrinomonadaceae bacterium]|nr:M28 family peptidase [Pyrinomonadaceae bacterium]
MRRFKLFSFILIGLLTLQPAAFVCAQQTAAGGAANANAPKAAPALKPIVPSSAVRKAAERITEKQLKEYLYYIASDAMEGRDTPSRGLDETARFIAEHLTKAKLKPAGDEGTYFQRISLRSTRVDPNKTTARMGEQEFRLGTDFLPGGRRGGEASGALVYVGHGWIVRSKNIDSYRGLDVRDKLVVISGNGMALPAGLTREEINALPAGDWESPISYAQKNGAAGLLLIPQRFERAWRAGRRAIANSAYSVEKLEDETARALNQTGSMLPAIIPSAEMVEALFAGEQTTGADIMRTTLAGNPVQGFALREDKRLSFSVSLNSSTATTQNVVAVLEGSDPVLKNEYVALGAHYDHVGVGVEVDGDRIYNGADDDGSGTTALLAMAEALARGTRPKRSVLFVWHCGEEKGLWGSDYFTNYPTVPLEQVVAQINIDMIGRSKKPGDTNPRNRMLTGPNEIYVVGSRVLSTELGDLNERLNRGYLNLDFNYHYDRPNDPEALWTRSDHFNYARKGVPIVFFFNGVHEDYHRPSDTPDKIDYQKLLNVTRTIFVLATEVANAPKRPFVDKQLPPGMSTRDNR